MTQTVQLGGKIVLDRPRQRRRIWGYLTVLVAFASVAGAYWAWESGYRHPLRASSETGAALELWEVDLGDVFEAIVENGTLESASNTVVRCEVEALIGMVGGSKSSGASGTNRSGSGSSTSSSSGSSSTSGQGSSSSSGSSGGGSSTQGAATTKSKAGASKKGSGSGSSSSSSGSGSSASSSGSNSGSDTSSSGSGSSSSSGSSSGSSFGSGTSSSTPTTSSSKPVIRSFSYVVTPHTPLRGATAKSTTTTAAGSSQNSQSGSSGPASGGGGGNRGGGGGGGYGRGFGRGGRGSGMMDDEKPGSTRIISILPEGQRITKGQIICQLDSSAFADELQAQLIRYAQAEAWHEQAKAILEVNLITLREYRDGIYPQDLQLIRQYITTCRIEKERATSNAKWSRDMTDKGLRTRAQLKADLLSEQQTAIALEEAEGMLVRLEKFTGPKIIKSLEANVKAIEADKKTQEAAFQLERQRRDRLQRNIAHCTLRAPDDGLLVYINQANRWGMIEQAIDEGVTVREGQPIFQLPDPKHMRVKTRINETKLARIKTGQRALIKVDAFPERPLAGSVAEITAISTPANGPFSDVRIYYAIVSIEQGFDDLRPGLTAEVFFEGDARKGVPRVPIQAIRSHKGKHYLAVHQPTQSLEARTSWRWKPVEIGLSDLDFVEVIAGVKQGEKVIADSHTLPAPEPALQAEAQSPAVATASFPF